MTSRAVEQELAKLRSTANYQFGGNLGNIIFRGNIKVTHSKRTGRMRLIYKDGELIATLRPNNGLLALTASGARVLLRHAEKLKHRVVVRSDVASFIMKGGNVFAKHVVKADGAIRPQDEVLVVDEGNRLLAVGRAFLSGMEMTSFKSGVAIKVRSGVED